MRWLRTRPWFGRRDHRTSAGLTPSISIASGLPPSAPPSAPPGARGRSRAQRAGLRQGMVSLALCYLTGLAVFTISNSAHAGWLQHAFPRIGGGNQLDNGSINQAWAVIQQQYVIRSIGTEVGTTGAEQGLIDALKAKYNDRFTTLFSPQQSQGFTSELSGQRQGSIGITVEARCAHETICAGGATPTEVVIEDVLRGQPADRAGLKNGDVLVAVGGTTLASLAAAATEQIDRSRPLIVGQPGSTVRVTVSRGGSDLDLTATRADLNIPSVYSQLFGRTLYLQITAFEDHTGGDTVKQLQQGLQDGATSIVLDLRNNPGGFVTEAQTVASQFVAPTSTHLDVVVRRGRLDGGADPNSAQSVTHDQLQGNGVAYTPKLVVLVDGNSASAAEIVSACLEDYGRGALVGQKTFGKGSVQEGFPLPDGNEVHLTVEKWFGPSGESIDGQGITPGTSVALPSPDDRFKLDSQSVDPSQDPQLQTALRLAGG